MPRATRSLMSRSAVYGATPAYFDDARLPSKRSGRRSRGLRTGGKIPRRKIYLARDMPLEILIDMSWRVEFHRDFVPEFRAFGRERKTR